jgi:hypothetical protein
MGGRSLQVRHSSTSVGDRLALTFNAVDDFTLVAIRQHFINAGGGFESFLIDKAVWSGTPDPTRPDCTWKYAGQPIVTDVGCGKHDITVELVMVPDLPPPLPQIIFYPTATSFEYVEIALEPDTVTYSQPRDAVGWTPPTLVSSGGPFNEPYVASTPRIQGFPGNDLYFEMDQLQLPPSVDLTLEGWARLPEDWKDKPSNPNILRMSANRSLQTGVGDLYMLFLNETPPVAYPLLYAYSDTIDGTDGGIGYDDEFSDATVIQWMHWAFVRSQNGSVFYVNGIKLKEVDFAFGNRGEGADFSVPFIFLLTDGDIAQHRLVIGRALYETDTIQVPTRPFYKP